jgi:hypothetical protein
MTLDTCRRSLRAAFVLGALLGLLPLAALAHTLGEPAPFHLSPGDHFRIPVMGGTFSGVATVQVRFTPVGGGADTTQAPEDVVADTSVGVRVPTALAVGQYDVSVLLSGTPSDAPVRIWVRQRPFRMIRRSSVHLPGAPSGADFKDADFADLDNDGFLDIFQANSVDGSDVDRLQLNQRGRAPGDRDCSGASDFCDMTTSNFENTVSGVPAGDRTYDADLVDLDLDADLDLVRIDRGAAPVRVFLNDGTGHFKDRTITRAGVGPALLPALSTITGIVGNTARMDYGDADGDGRPDLLTCSWSGAQNLLLLNRLHSGGGFVIANDNPCDPASPTAHALCRIRSDVNRGCAFGDFDNDGRLDIIAPTMTSARPDLILLNTGNNGSGIPQFEVREDWVRASGGGPQGPNVGGIVKVADMDGDGDDDALVASPDDSGNRRILWNDNGTRLVELSTSRYPFAGMSDAYDAQLADLDRDGDLDVLAAPWTGSLRQVLINRGGRNGNMQFEAPAAADLWFAEGPADPTSTSPNFELSMSPGDYDLDGDIDLLTGGFSSVGLWRSDLFDQPGEDRDWVFVLDRTRSMITGRDFFEPAKNALKTFLSQRRPGDDAGLVTFDYAGTQPSNPNAPDDVTKAQVESQVGVRTMAELGTDVDLLSIGTCSGFCTAIGWAIKTGKEVAEDSPDADREKVVVLLTDGEQNQGPHPDTIIPGIPSNIRLYTIALGSDTDDRMLSALATNGGKFYFAGRSDDYASVQSALREIDEDLEGDSTGKQPLVPSSRWTFFPLLMEVLPRSPLLRGLGNEVFLAQPRAATVPVASRVDAFVVDPDDRQVRFTLSWRQPSRTNRMILTDPKGRTYPLAGDNRVREQRTDKSHVIEVADPLSGVWLVQPHVTADSGPAKVTATASTDLRLAAEPVFPIFYLDEPILVSATLLRAPAGTQAQAVLTTPSKRTVQAAGRPNQKGGFDFQFENLGEAGSYKVEMVAVGPPQRPFVRTWQSAVHVAAPQPNEPDLRTAGLTLDRTELAAGSGTATATLTLRRRDGSPLPGANVSFLSTLGQMTGTVQDLGDGRYTQTLEAGKVAGAGALRVRVDLTRLRNEVGFTVKPGKVDPKGSIVSVIAGPLKLCTGGKGSYIVRVEPVDVFGNPVRGATVEVRQTSGPRLSWLGPAQAVGMGETYERRFHAPKKPGTYTFTASVDGLAVGQEISLPAFKPKSREGRAMGCTAGPGSKLARWLAAKKQAKLSYKKKGGA